MRETSSESLGQFANDADQCCVLVLEPLVVSPQVRQGLGQGTESAAALGRLPAHSTQRTHLQLLLQLRCLPLQGPALLGKVRSQVCLRIGAGQGAGQQSSVALLVQTHRVKAGNTVAPSQLPPLTNLSSSSRAGLSAKRSCRWPEQRRHRGQAEPGPAAGGQGRILAQTCLSFGQTEARDMTSHESGRPRQNRNYSSGPWPEAPPRSCWVLPLPPALYLRGPLQLHLEL